MTILYFSVTGNGIQVARALGGTLLSIPQLHKNQRFTIKDDSVGIICPTYCADAPKMVRQYLRKARIEAEYVFGIATYGYEAGEAEKHLVAYLQQAAGHVEYVNKVKMVDTALTRFETQKQIDRLPSKDVEGQLALVKADIDSRQHRTPETSLFHIVADRLYHMAAGGQIGDKRALSFTVSGDCIACGTCARVCPADNVKIVDKRPVFGTHCEGCLGCLHNCPKAAIHVPHEQSNVRYRNANVTLKDIIDGNNPLS